MKILIENIEKLIMDYCEQNNCSVNVNVKTKTTDSVLSKNIVGIDTEIIVKSL